MERITGLIIFVSLLIFGIYFLDKGKLGAGTFTTYMGITLLCALAFYGFDRLKELDIKNFRMILTEMKETKKEIYAAKNDVENMAKDILEISYILGEGGGVPPQFLVEIKKILFTRLSISPDEASKLEKNIKEKMEGLTKEINEKTENTSK